MTTEHKHYYHFPMARPGDESSVGYCDCGMSTTGLAWGEPLDVARYNDRACLYCGHYDHDHSTGPIGCRLCGCTRYTRPTIQMKEQLKAIDQLYRSTI